MQLINIKFPAKVRNSREKFRKKAVLQTVLRNAILHSTISRAIKARFASIFKSLEKQQKT